MQHACNTMVEAKWLSKILQTTGPKALALAEAGGITFLGHREEFSFRRPAFVGRECIARGR
jgi:hypothetical protein